MHRVPHTVICDNNRQMLRFVILTIFAFGSALASPASALVGQYLEFVTKYHVDADSINAAALKARLEAMLTQRCGKDATCPTTAVYDDLRALTKTLPDASSSFLSPIDLRQLVTSAQSYSLGLEMRFDIVLANINRNIILNDIKCYVDSMKNNSQLLLSGFYANDANEIRKSAQYSGLKFITEQQKENWCCLVFEKTT